jgi:nitrogen fixation/metabolism regulation signal transduction histidine kinase
LPAPFLYVIGFSLLSVLLSFGILVLYLRKNSDEVDNVLTQLQSGNLKARFPVKKLDEAGRMMIRFNEMADEIDAERARQAAERAKAQLKHRQADKLDLQAQAALERALARLRASEAVSRRRSTPRPPAA